MTQFRLFSGLLFALLLLHPTLGAAQQRPLITEDPETIGGGQVLLEGGFEYARDAEYPVSGLRGHLLRLPTFGVSVGISPIAELQFDGGLRDRLAITDRTVAPLSGMLNVSGERATSVEDVVVGTKIRVAPETARRPAFGVRFATKLPNAGNEAGLGLDTTDFFAAILAGKTVQSVRVVANVGVGILGDPTRGDRQNDVLTYGVSFARALTTHAEVVGEVNGRASTRNGTPPPGTESRSALRLGARYTLAGWRADGGLLIGLAGAEPTVGFGAGFTYVFHAFRIP